MYISLMWKMLHNVFTLLVMLCYSAFQLLLYKLVYMYMSKDLCSGKIVNASVVTVLLEYIDVFIKIPTYYGMLGPFQYNW